jgi:hypothetical protein
MALDFALQNYTKKRNCIIKVHISIKKNKIRTWEKPLQFCKNEQGQRFAAFAVLSLTINAVRNSFYLIEI